MARYQHLILDRDGVLNVDGTSEAPITVERWRWEDGSLEALALLTMAGVRISVATNQSCIGRGVISAQDVEAVHARLRAEAVHAGATISAIHVCPHTSSDGCACRKPAPGLILDAIRTSGIAPAGTLVVGDALRDLQAGREAGVDVVLVRTGKGRATEQMTEAGGTPVFNRLLDVAQAVVAETLG